MAEKTCNDSLAGLIAPYTEAVMADLDLWLVEPDTPTELANAMRYCVLGGGKRLRPVLAKLACEAVGGDPSAEPVRRAAVAVELIHCYSLVHDDLPSMDDDTLRRGLPTAHVKFGEAMAILVGDAMLTRAMAILGEIGGELSGLLVTQLASASGSAGMIAGQVADMELCSVPGGVEGLNYIHAQKTAALIRAAAVMGAICGGATKQQLALIGEYGHNLGMAFQLIDDLLDVTGSAVDLGKTPGKDAQTGKRTHVAEIGLDEARSLANRTTQQAIDAAEKLGDSANSLCKLGELLIRRTS